MGRSGWTRHPCRIAAGHPWSLSEDQTLTTRTSLHTPNAGRGWRAAAGGRRGLRGPPVSPSLSGARHRLLVHGRILNNYQISMQEDSHQRWEICTQETVETGTTE